MTTPDTTPLDPTRLRELAERLRGKVGGQQVGMPITRLAEHAAATLLAIAEKMETHVMVKREDAQCPVCGWVLQDLAEEQKP